MRTHLINRELSLSEYGCGCGEDFGMGIGIYLSLWTVVAQDGHYSSSDGPGSVGSISAAKKYPYRMNSNNKKINTLNSRDLERL
jgi:hypothetical protein